MNRLSTNNYYNNFDTGEFIQCDKLKPVQNMQNTVKIELFDSLTGRKKEEVVAENVINNYLNKYAARFMGLLHAFTYYPQSGGIGRTLFGQLVLSSSNAAEDANQKYFKGNVIGWADKYIPYVGADTRRGSVNSAETGMTSYNTVKYVFDFPTSAANGTFQSLYWMPSDHVAAATAQYQPCIAHVYSIGTGGINNAPAASDYGSMCVAGDKLYHTKAGVIYSTKINQMNQLIRNSETTVIEKDYTATDNNLRGLQWDGTYFWVFGEATDKIYKFDSSWNLITSWAITVATYLNGYKQFAYFNGYLYTIKYVNATTWNLYKFNLDGTLAATYNIYNSGGNYDLFGTKDDYMRLFANDDNLVVIHASTGTNVRFYSMAIIEVDGSGNVLADYGGYYVTSVPTIMCWNTNYKMIETNGAVMFNLLKHPTAQVLLPSSVTKTNSDFLKITYTLEFDTSYL